MYGKLEQRIKKDIQFVIFFEDELTFKIDFFGFFNIISNNEEIKKEGQKLETRSICNIMYKKEYIFRSSSPSVPRYCKYVM